MDKKDFTINEQICANCAYTQGRQSWCDGKYCKKLIKGKSL